MLRERRSLSTSALFPSFANLLFQPTRYFFTYVLNMNESELKAICDRDSFYISLEDQSKAVAKLPCPRRPVSKERTTRVHFAVHHGHHWAAVQLSISPFEIRAIPKQKFFRCFFRYIPCCETNRLTDISPDVLSAVQRIYDCYYQPTQWDFSSQYW